MSEQPPSVNITNELAKERNREAAERTLMAWIRTSLSLISFGFGVDKIIGAINRSRLVPTGRTSRCG
jgi:putative membrane protein